MTLDRELGRASERLRRLPVQAPPFGGIRRRRRVRIGVAVAITAAVLAVGSLAAFASASHKRVAITPSSPSSTAVLVTTTTDRTAATTTVPNASSTVTSGTSTVPGNNPRATSVTSPPATAPPRPITPPDADALHLWSGKITFGMAMLTLGDHTVVHATVTNNANVPMLPIYSAGSTGVVFRLTCNDAGLALDPQSALHNNGVDAITTYATPILQPGESVTLTDTLTPRTIGPIICGIGLGGSIGLGDANLNSVTSVLPVVVPPTTTSTTSVVTTTTTTPTTHG